MTALHFVTFCTLIGLAKILARPIKVQLLENVLVCIMHGKSAEQAQQSIRWGVNKLMSISTRSTLHETSVDTVIGVGA